MSSHSHTFKILRYEMQSLLRSQWLFLFAAFFFLITEILFRFGSDPSRVLVSLMNVVLLVIPLVSLILGSSYFYNAREFIELMLAQPTRRSSLFFGKFVGLASTLSLLFLLAVGIPFVMRGFRLKEFLPTFLVLGGVGCLYIWVFLGFSFFLATFYEDKIKGMGSAILFWLYLAIIYDAVLLLFIYLFQEYPFEAPLLVLVMLNPIDLGRILILLHLDMSALMSYTGASIQQLLGSWGGQGLALASLLLWIIAPLWLGLRLFQKKDF